MREHAFHRHRTAAELVARSRVRNKKRKLESVRRLGMWAFVIVPDDPNDPTPSVVHFWCRSDKDPREVAYMIGHELGHIADGGPKDDVLGYAGEEARADEFGRTAQEVLSVLIHLDAVSGRAGRPLDVRGPSRAGRLRRSRR